MVGVRWRIPYRRVQRAANRQLDENVKNGTGEIVAPHVAFVVVVKSEPEFGNTRAYQNAS